MTDRTPRTEAVCVNCGHEIGAHFCSYAYNSDLRETCGCDEAQARTEALGLREAAQGVVDRWLQPSLANAMAFDDSVRALSAILAAEERQKPRTSHGAADGSVKTYGETTSHPTVHSEEEDR